MDREFASAAKSREKERKQRVDEARKKLAVEKKKSEMVKIEQERIALVTTQRRVEEAAAREAAEAQAQAEQELTGGITFCQVLTAVPISSEGERIVLPPSALQTLETQSALDVAKPLGFEVCALDSTGAVVSKTHCGVLEFTAEEGTVGVPPAAALSLTKEAGVGALRDCRIRVKFVKLPTPPKSFVRLQPRGQGFHTKGQDVVNLDLKAVLERELSRHTAVTKGDWIAIRSDKTTYELVVVDLEPCSALALTSTDLEVDLLPSEAAVAAAEEREQKKREAEQAQEKVAAAALLAVQAEAERRAKVVAAAEAAKASLPPEPDAASSSSSCSGGSAELSGRVVNVLVRLPSGAQLSRRFRQTDPLAALFSFVASEKQVCEDLALAATDFALNMNYPKKSFTLEDCAGSAEAEAGGGSGPTLGEAGLTGRREALFLQDLTPPPPEAGEDLQVAAREVASALAAMEDDDDGHGSSGGVSGGGCVGEAAPLSVASDSTGSSSSSSSSGGQQPLFPQLNSSPTNVWATAADEHRAQLDRALSSEAKERTEAGALVDGDGGGDAEGAGGGGGGGEGGGGVDKVSVFHMLVDRGLSHTAAAQAAQKYSEQLVELDRMGFGSADAATSVSLLERYGGRMLRVVNALSERVLLPKEEGPTLRGSGGGGSSSSSDQGRREGGVGAREQDTTATQPLLQAAAVVAEAAPSSLLAPPRPLEVATFQTKFAELVSAGVAPNEAAAQALHLMQQQPGPQAQTSSVSGGSSSSSSSSGDCLNAMQVDSSSISSSSSSPLSQATATTTAPVIGVGVDAGLGGMDGGGRWASELSELASMGFSDSVTNAALLERYQGRLVRVINALTGGD